MRSNAMNGRKGPEAEGQFPGDNKRKRTFDGHELGGAFRSRESSNFAYRQRTSPKQTPAFDATSPPRLRPGLAA
jgi:hypothetical protein